MRNFSDGFRLGLAFQGGAGLTRFRLFTLLATGAMLALSNVTAFAATQSLVTGGSPPGAFPQNKQNEPAMAVDASHPNILAAGANDEIDLSPCSGSTCSFTPGVGISGIYFSFDSGASWTQPTYSGWSARGCNGVDPCTPGVGQIGTVPNYYEAGLVSGGDPALAFGPIPVNGKFDWKNGSRLYYANLTSNFSTVRTGETFAGYEAVAVSTTDDVVAASQGVQTAWSRPIIISQQSQTTFSDKEQIWADNAATSPHFGTVYVCWADFGGNGKASPAPLTVGVSQDGGTTWTQHPISSAANNSNNNPADGCTVRTDSHGTAYVFGVATQNRSSFEVMSTSTDGGQKWSTPIPVVGPVTQPGVFDPVIGRPTIDGIAGARSDLAPAPSVDIANGAPTGIGATDTMVMSYVSGTIDRPDVLFTSSPIGGNGWSQPVAVQTSGDRGYYAAPAISPTGTDVWLVYNAFTTPYRYETSSPRSLVGVVLHGTVAGGRWSFNEAFRGTAGDPRGSSQNNLKAEFLGDYVYAVATATYGAAVWNDVRNADDCPAVDDWRLSLHTSTPGTKPSPGTDCPVNFGNSDIYSWTSAR